MESDFCVDALEEAISCYGAPEIFNTDQGAQFTSEAFTSVLKASGVKISMDGKGRWVDNVFVERLWRSIKYEEVYLRAYESVNEARSGIGDYLKFYNSERKHQGLGETPDQACFGEVLFEGIANHTDTGEAPASLLRRLSKVYRSKFLARQLERITQSE